MPRRKIIDLVKEFYENYPISKLRCIECTKEIYCTSVFYDKYFEIYVCEFCAKEMEDQETLLLIQTELTSKELKQCPKCGIGIGKVDGCNWVKVDLLLFTILLLSLTKPVWIQNLLSSNQQ